jgi:hypothetical protein
VKVSMRHITACIEILRARYIALNSQKKCLILKPKGQLYRLRPIFFAADLRFKIDVKLKLVSSEEIDEHKSLFHHQDILLDYWSMQDFNHKKIASRDFKWDLIF